MLKKNTVIRLLRDVNPCNVAGSLGRICEYVESDDTYYVYGRAEPLDSEYYTEYPWSGLKWGVDFEVAEDYVKPTKHQCPSCGHKYN